VQTLRKIADDHTLSPNVHTAAGEGLAKALAQSARL
jgi:hypothetical protein